MVYLFEGPGLLFPFKQVGDLDRVIAYRGPVDEGTVEAWRKDVEGSYDRARAGLRRLSPVDDVDRAICLIGEGLAQEDIEESFSCFWRAVERIAKRDLSRARAAAQGGNLAAGVPYANLRMLGFLNSQPVTLDTDDAVSVTVAARAPEYKGAPVSELYTLRSAIIHDNPTPDEVQRIARARGDAMQLAYRVVKSALEESVG